MTDIRNPHNAADEETGNIIKKAAVAELSGINAELMRNHTFFPMRVVTRFLKPLIYIYIYIHTYTL